MLKAEIKHKTKGGGISRIIKKLPKAVQEGVVNAAKSTAEIAIQLSPRVVGNCIKVEIINTSNNEVKAARIFTDTKITNFAPYVEFGTGIYVKDEGVKEAIRLKRAKSIPWYIHVSMVPDSFARYGYPLVVGANGEKYWEVNGMRPQPYMWPAAHRNKNNSIDEIAKAINEMLQEVGK